MADYDWGGGGFGGVFRGEVRLEWEWLGEWMLGQWHRNVPGWGGGGRMLGEGDGYWLRGEGGWFGQLKADWGGGLLVKRMIRDGEDREKNDW